MAYRESGSGSGDSVSQGTSAGKTVSGPGVMKNKSVSGAPQGLADGNLNAHKPGPGWSGVPAGSAGPKTPMGNQPSNGYGLPDNTGSGDTSFNDSTKKPTD